MRETPASIGVRAMREWLAFAEGHGASPEDAAKAARYRAACAELRAVMAHADTPIYLIGESGPEIVTP